LCQSWTQVVAGMIASVTNDYVLSNTLQWKCVTAVPNNDPSWPSKQYVESSAWKSAVFAGDNVPYPANIHGRVAASLNADWIWTKNYGNTTIDKTVYCRTKIRRFLPFNL
jgi:hypothetical protein